MGCRAHITVRASEDGQKLEVKSFDENHNHEVNRELFRNLYHQRRLGAAEKENIKQMLDMKANKKIIQSNVMQSSGKVLLMKDIHNLKRSDNKSRNDHSTLQNAVNELNKCNGAFVKIQTDGTAENTMTGLFFQDARMRQVFAEYPEFLCVDATYKVNDLRMPLYLLIAENGNGQSEIVGVWVVANETEETIQSMVDIFKEQNPKWTDTTTVMTDKDFIEREVFSRSFPDAKLRICLFHVLRSFRREVTTDKMNVNKKQRDALLETIQKLAYSRSLAEYETHQKTLIDRNIPAFDSYYNNSWHPIKEQWVIGLSESTSLGNNTNNRVESLNQKVKQVIDKNSKFDAFAADLVHFLHMHRTEINGKICKSVNKVTGISLDEKSPDFQYRRQLTDYAFKLVSSQLANYSNIEITETWDGFTCNSNGREYSASEINCSCDFFRQFSLPCKHIFAVRKKKEMDLFEEQLLSQRWTKAKYLGLLNQTTTENQLQTTSSQSTRKVTSQQDRFRLSFRITQRLASVAAESTGTQFDVKINQLNELLSAWENSRDVIISQIDNPVRQEEYAAYPTETTSSQYQPDELAVDVPPEPPRQEQSSTEHTVDHQAHVINEEMHSTPYQPEELAEDVSHEPPPMIADPVMDDRISESSTSVRFAEPGSHEDVTVEENENHRNQSRKRLSLKRRHVTEQECIKTTNDARFQDRLPDMPLSADDLSDLVLLGAARPNQSTDVAANNRTEQSIERNGGDATTLEYKDNRKEQAPRKRLSLKLRRSSITNANLPQEMFSPASTPRETEPLNLLAEPWIENNDANKTTDAANVLLQLAAGISTTDDTSENTSSISSTGTDQQCETVTNSGPQHVDITDISLPSKIPKRGRPKGSELTVIGLPRKKLRLQNSKMVPFERKTDSQKQSFMLAWFVEKRVIDKCISENHIIEEEEVEVNPNNVSLACKDVDLDLIKQFFSDDAWKVLMQTVDIRRRQEWTCNVCQEELETRSCGCDRCLLWYHFHCASLSSKPRTKFWYCQPCYAASDA